ncbi:MAG: hypothetical protein IMX06_09710 [Kyrpidia tusciae]|nr:hypothetical protein [Kyrpidia tusciae]MBE3553119.1 hypothetical protein [Kyrpidia tusciae]
MARNRGVNPGRTLVLVGGLFAAATTLETALLNLVIWTSNPDLVPFLTYQAAVFLFAGLGFAFAGILERFDPGIPLRTGAAVLAAVAVWAALAEHGLGHRPLAAGFLNGLGTGLYWWGFNKQWLRATAPRTRDHYQRLHTFTASTASISTPLAAEIVFRTLPRGEHPLLFGLVVVLLVLLYRTSRRLAPPPPELFDWKETPPLSGSWRGLLGASLLWGSRESLALALPLVFVYVVTGTEAASGLYLILSSTATLMGGFLVERWLTARSRSRLLWLSAGVLVIAGLGPTLFPSSAALYIFGAANALAVPFAAASYGAASMDIIGGLPQAGTHMGQYFLMREWFLTAGRLGSLTILMAGALVLPTETAFRLGFFLTAAGGAAFAAGFAPVAQSRRLGYEN